MLDLALSKFVYEHEKVEIDTYRRFLVVFFNIILISLFSIFSVLFLFHGPYFIVIVKMLFNIAAIGLLIAFKNKESHLTYALLVSLLFMFYSLIIFFDTSESRYGFIWILFIPPIFIFLLGYKKGGLYSIIFAIVLIVIGLYDVYYLKNQFIKPIYFLLFYSAFFGFMIGCIIIDYFVVLFHKRIISISITDPLTNLYNRRKIDEVLHKEFKSENDLSVAILDIDDFKLINDRYGHQIGDEVLKVFADTIKNNVRISDMVGRWGGEEFIIVLPNTNEEEAFECMKKIRKCIKQIDFKSIDKLTCSFGVSSSKNDKSSLEKLINMADCALYQAKKEGKDKIIISTMNEGKEIDYI